jgi:hypothetical protein
MNEETGDAKDEDLFLHPKPNIINLNTPPSAVKEGGTTTDFRTDCNTAGQTEKAERGWEGVSSNGLEGGLPTLVPPGRQWMENAVQSYVVIMNVMNKVLANGVRPKVFNNRSRDERQFLTEELQFRIDAALLFIAAGLYDPSVKGSDAENMAPSVALWMPLHFKQGCTRNAAAAYEFFTTSTLQDFDGHQISHVEVAAMRRDILFVHSTVESKWLLLLWDRTNEMHKLRVTKRMDDKVKAGQECINLWRQPGAIATLSALHLVVKQGEENRRRDLQSRETLMAKMLPAKQENGKKNTYFSPQEKTFLRKQLELQRYATLHHFLYVEEDQDGQQPAYIGDKVTTQACITLRSFKTLQPKTWLNDSVMDVYFHICRTVG